MCGNSSRADFSHPATCTRHCLARSPYVLLQTVVVVVHMDTSLRVDGRKANADAEGGVRSLSTSWLNRPYLVTRQPDSP